MEEMNSFMVEIDLPEEFSNEFIQLIPRQRVHINKMMKKGRIANYSLAFDHRKLWVVIHAESASAAKQIVRSFPISNHVRFKVHDLLFHDSNSMRTPQLWLN